jgi:hypothetical protein
MTPRAPWLPSARPAACREGLYKDRG